MERRKYQKKAGLYFILFMAVAATLTGCKRKLRSDKYSEWVDAIGINEYPHVGCWVYEEYDIGLGLCIMCYDFEASYDECRKIIANHNAFVMRNPGYFPEDFDINITLKYGTQEEIASFSNRTDSDLEKGYGDYTKLPEIEAEKGKTHRMRYVFPNNMGDMNTKFEAEVIMSSPGKYIEEVENTHAWSEDFEGFDTIVVKILPSVEAEITVDKALEKIHRANPDAEIYYLTCITYPDEYEIKKYTPKENSN